MRRLGPVFAAGAVLVALASAGPVGAAPVTAAPTAAAAKAKPAKAKPAKAIRKARALKRCRAIRRKPRRRACVKRVNRRFAPAKPSKPAKPVKPVTPPFTGVTHYVEVGDDYFSPTVLTIHAGDAVVWQWLPVNHDDHNVSMYKGPPGVDPLDFERSDAPAVGSDWGRVFTVKGTYVMGCSLHHLQRITIEVE